MIDKFSLDYFWLCGFYSIQFKYKNRKKKILEFPQDYYGNTKYKIQNSKYNESRRLILS